MEDTKEVLMLDLMTKLVTVKHNLESTVMIILNLLEKEVVHLLNSPRRMHREVLLIKLGKEVSLPVLTTIEHQTIFVQVIEL